jgi:hypothetical protein
LTEISYYNRINVIVHIPNLLTFDTNAANQILLGFYLDEPAIGLPGKFAQVLLLPKVCICTDDTNLTFLLLQSFLNLFSRSDNTTSLESSFDYYLDSVFYIGDHNVISL